MTPPPDKMAQDPSPDGRVARGKITRARVLDAAERCFAATGFDAVSIRQIANEAGVTLGVVGFHGGSKEALFHIVLARRSDTLNKLRREALAALRVGGKFGLEDLLDAYITPYLDIVSRGDPQWQAYAQLVARIASDDRYYREVRTLYDPVAKEYLAAMAALRPDADKRVLATILTMTVSAMLSIVASSARVGSLSGQSAPKSPLEYRRVLIDFCSGGLLRALDRREL